MSNLYDHEEVVRLAHARDLVCCEAFGMLRAMREMDEVQPQHSATVDDMIARHDALSVKINEQFERPVALWKPAAKVAVVSRAKKTEPITPGPDTIVVFPHFWMFKNEGGWRWVSRDATKSSRAAFDFATQCALDAERTLARAAS